MKKQMNFKKAFSLFFTVVLISAMALLSVGCGKTAGASNISSGSESISAVDIGEGKRHFTLTVEADGVKNVYNVKTDKTTVGEALLELKLISGEQGDYGLYVKKVDGITADYDTDKAYWALYIDEQYANSGVDKTEIKDGEAYTLKKEKA